MADTMKPAIINRDRYLDARLPAFGTAERAGHIRYEPIAGVVEISDPAIMAHFGAEYAR